MQPPALPTYRGDTYPCAKQHLFTCCISRSASATSTPASITWAARRTCRNVYHSTARARAPACAKWPWEAPKGEGRKLERKLKNQHNGRKLCPVCSQVWEPSPDVDFYSIPADFAQALDDYAKGARYCKQGIDWAAVEEDRIGD